MVFSTFKENFQFSKYEIYRKANIIGDEDMYQKRLAKCNNNLTADYDAYEVK